MDVENYSRKNSCCSCCLSDVHSASTAAELHPIVEVQSGYFFGAISDGKWMKADETANLLSDESAYRVYGLTKALGEAKGGKPKLENVPREETLFLA
jgi:hypothetical protein